MLWYICPHSGLMSGARKALCSCLRQPSYSSYLHDSAALRTAQCTSDNNEAVSCMPRALLCDNDTDGICVTVNRQCVTLLGRVLLIWAHLYRGCMCSVP